MDDAKFNAAWQDYLHGRQDSAMEKLRALLADDPENAMYHGALAACLLEKSRIYAAAYEIAIAQQLDPEEYYFLFIRAQVEFLQGKLKLALAICDEALALSTHAYEVHLLKSTIYLELQQRPQALAHIENAAELAPDHWEVETAFGHYYLRSGDIDKAASHASRALALDAQNERANILMGKCKLAKGETTEAEYHAKFVILHNPNSQEALRLFCDIKMRNNIWLGCWWRFNHWVGSLGSTKGAALLIGAFLITNLVAQVLLDVGYPKASLFVSYTWLALVVYSWVGIPFYARMLKKELQQFAFNQHF